MKKFEEKINAYESKMKRYLHEEKKKETKASIKSWVILAVFLVMLLTIIYYPSLKPHITRLTQGIETLYHWVLTTYFNYEIISD